MNGVTDLVKALGPGRLAAMAGVVAILVGFFAFVMLRWSQPQFVPLFAEIALNDGAAVARELDRLQVRYQLQNDGTTILVPREDVARARMRLAEQNLPRGGGVGYEIFDRGETLGTTSFVQNLNHVRALEGELARSIRAIDRVQAARVHIVMPERQIFARERQEPTASIVLRMRGRLEQAQVRAVQHLVASAVPGMKPGNVSIVDEAGQLLATGRGEEESVAAVGLEERRVAQEQRLRRAVEDILGRVVGPGRARVQVAAELDWNRVSETQDLFDPEQRVQRSTQSRSERQQTQEARDRQVTVGNELPGNRAAGGGDAPQTRDQTEKTEEVVNYEISRTQRQQTTEAGRVRRISVAVLVDGLYQRQGDQLVYQPRPAEEIERLTALVRSAIGFDEQRGDKVEIVNLRFADGPAVDSLQPEAAPSLFAFERQDLVRFIELGVFAVLALLTLLIVVRPLLRKAIGGDAPKLLGGKEGGGSQPALADGRGPAAGALPAPGEAGAPHAAAGAPGGGAAGAGLLAAGAAGSVILGKNGETLVVQEGGTNRALEVAQLANQLHAQSVEKIGELVAANPNEATSIIRSWMTEPAAA